MTIVYLVLSMAFSAMITIAGRLYNQKNESRAHVSGLYNMLVPMFCALGWLMVWMTDFSFELSVLPYSLVYGLCYSTFTVGMLGALKSGSTSLTALVKQMALVGVSFWGFAFWNTPFTLVSGVGILLIVISLAMCLLTKEKGKDTGSMAKWLFCALMITVGNAGCSITQRYQQMAFDYQHKNMFMFFALLFSSLVCFLLALRENKSSWGAAFKTSWIFPALSGFSSAAANVFILIMVREQVSPVIIYPGIAVGGLMITTLVSLFGFREKLRRMQWCGLAVGAVALVLLNI